MSDKNTLTFLILQSKQQWNLTEKPFHSHLNIAFETFLSKLTFNSDRPMRSHLYKSINSVMVVFLHCTLMLTTVESIPQVLFALHLYSPAWSLVMLVMFNRFPSMISPVLMFLQITVGSGMPVTLQFTSTSVPSLAIFSSACLTGAAGALTWIYVAFLFTWKLLY